MTPITFDFEKYIPDFTINSLGQKSIICHKRKIHLKPTKEELVRQSFIKFLIEEKGYPINSIDIEKPISHFEKGKLGRADIVIYDTLDNMPLAVIECKEKTTELTDEIIEQLSSYNNTINALYAAFVLGNSVYFFDFIEVESSTELTPVVLKEIPTYIQLVNGADLEYTYPEEIIYERPPIHEPFSEELIDRYWDAIGEDTNPRLYPFIFNFDGWLYDYQDKLSFDNFNDIGERISILGGPMGGGFGGEYRSWEYIDDNKSYIITLGVKASGRFENDKHYGNRKGWTYLMVAINNHFSIELRIDKFVELNEGFATVWHDGTITVGKLGQAKRAELIDFILSHDASLVENNKIILARFDIKKEIKSNQSITRDFLCRITKYALLRDQFRLAKKQRPITRS